EPAGAATALLWKKQQAAKPGPYGYLPAQPYGNSGPETARIGGQACLGLLPGPAATGCDEAAERRRTADRPRLALDRPFREALTEQADRCAKEGVKGCIRSAPGQAAMGCNATAWPETPGRQECLGPQRVPAATG